jgi:hypothetical protein
MTLLAMTAIDLRFLEAGGNVFLVQAACSEVRRAVYIVETMGVATAQIVSVL